MSVTRQIVWNKPEECLPEVRSEWYDFENVSSPVLVQDCDGSIRMAKYITYSDEPFTKWCTTCSEGWEIKEPAYWAYVVKP